MAVKLIRKADGAEFTFDDADAAERLIRSGEGIPTDASLPVLNPEDGQVYHFQKPEDIAAAVQSGGVLQGSTGHRAHEMSGIEAGLRRLGQGFTGGNLDEILGLIKNTANGKGYATNRDEYRKGDEAAAQKLGPGLSTALDIAGAVAPAMIPGLGELTLGKGLLAGSKAAIARSAAQGAVAGAGYSNADLTKGEVGDFAGDVVTGGLAGAGTEYALPALGRTMRNVGQKAKEGLVDNLRPEVQRALAAGAGPKELRGVMRQRVLKASETLNDIGAFSGGELESVVPDAQKGVQLQFDTSRYSARPDKRALQDRIQKIADVTGAQIGDLLRKTSNQGSPDFVFTTVRDATQDSLADIIRNAVPGTEKSLARKTEEWLRRMKAAGNDFEELHKIKRSLGATAKFEQANGQTNPLGQVASELYGALNDAMKTEVDRVANETGNATLTRLNDVYHAASTYKKLLDQGVAAEEKQPRLFGILKQSSATAGAMGATVGAAIGGAPGAAVGATAGNALDQMIASTEGRLARADLGEKLARSFGKIPRTAAAVRDAITQNPNSFVPLLGQAGWQAIQKMPQAVWEQQARALMPVLEQAGVFEHSEYPTELDGRVDDQDKLPISQKLDTMLDQGQISPSSAFLEKSALAKSGIIPDRLRPQTASEIYARAQRNALLGF